ncbi:MAG: tetratricopeptide repeat protein, partial [Candidatus Gastranaerophilales bacterium]|nr:tetratricopeptide repeat protein [Candidatus Gastranaerophilales bacterium]
MDLDYKKLVDLAFELHSKNDFDKAEEIYKALLEVNPDDVNIINLYGMLCLSKNRADEAVSFFSRALILKKLPYIASNLAKAFYIKNDFDNALKFYKQALEFGESDDIYYSMAITYKQLKRYKDAILCYNRALKLNPNNYNALYNLSILYSEKKDIQKAIDTAIKCTFVKDSEELRTLLSGYFEEQKDYKNAIKQLKKAVEFNNKNYLYFYNLGVLYSRTGHVDSAVTNYKKAFKLNPQNIESYVNLSALYAQTNRELSLKYIKIAYEYAPNEENVILALAKAYKDNNCNKESMYILKDYLAKNSKCAEAYLLLA